MHIRELEIKKHIKHARYKIKITVQKILYETLLWGNIAPMGVAFYVNRLASYLILSCFMWTTQTTALNYAIYRDSKADIEAPRDKKQE